MPLKAFSFFHLNLAYSAISEERRPEVIARCYWPLLRLARKLNLPIGIEASAWTLETIQAIDPRWVLELKDLITSGPCEFIGCGYAQIIGPLVPAEVNQANLRIGMDVYEELLQKRPKVALVNEQAYSAGLVPLYKEAGYEAIIMEWDNPARANPEWPREWRYYPQYAIGADGERLPIIWNKSIAFQKVQRFVHREIELDEYLLYVQKHLTSENRAFPIYGNDVEVFDFRPGRYMTEAALEDGTEWERMEALYQALLKAEGIQFVKPSEVLALMSNTNAANDLRLETAACPIPVKKQDKYNIVRWALSGRDDLGVNTKCWRIYEALKESPTASEADWRELCYLWSSDFRTHITPERWKDYLERLDSSVERWTSTHNQRQRTPDQTYFSDPNHSCLKITRIGRFLHVVGSRLEVVFDCNKGLAVHSFTDRSVSDDSLWGTIPHGFFDDISWSADFYSGHLVFESPGRPKLTDLVRVEPAVSHQDYSVKIFTKIQTSLGLIEKCWTVSQSIDCLKLQYRIDWPTYESGSLRLGFITLNPNTFNRDEIFYETHNGGKNIETFSCKGSFDHGQPVSYLVSSNQVLGLTGGKLAIGDNRIRIRAALDLAQSRAHAQVFKRDIMDSHMTRVGFSLSEVDDTSRGSRPLSQRISVSYSATDQEK
jgi:hypothetical protein